MAIDSIYINPTLDIYKNMLKDIQSQNKQGEDVDKMIEIIKRMEQLASELSDINDFMGIAMQEDLYGKFSTHYTKALISQTQANENNNYDVSTYFNKILTL